LPTQNTKRCGPSIYDKANAYNFPVGSFAKANNFPVDSFAKANKFEFQVLPRQNNFSDRLLAEATKTQRMGMCLAHAPGK
jgi:hypothetical protein